MLRVLTRYEFDSYVDFAYALGMDRSRSVYPTYTDGIKTKADFVARSLQAFDREDEEILLFLWDEKPEGWIHYYALPEDRYLSFCAFNVADHVSEAFDEFLRYVGLKYAGCTLHVGLPTENVALTAHLKALGFEKIEESHVGILFFSSYRETPEGEEIVRVDRDNYASFAALHRQHDETMFWNSERLLSALDEWQIYLLFWDGEAVGAIYFCFYGEQMMEIFGVDYQNGCFDGKIFASLLGKALNEGKRAGAKDLTFFHTEEEHAVVTSYGFSMLGRYELYSQTIDGTLKGETT